MKVSRRSFLKGSLSAAGVTALNFTSPMAHAFYNDCGSDKPQKALVGINLGGGNDGFNCFIPTRNEQYDDYKELRTSLAFEESDLLPLSLNDNGLNLALSPELAEIKWLFEEGKGLPVLNVGPLMKERDATSNIDELKPVHIFSHNHQSAVTQTHTGPSIDDQGWGGKSAFILEDAFSLSELTPIFEVGSQTVWTNSIPMSANRIGTSMPAHMSLHHLGEELYDAFRQKEMTDGSLYKQYYSELCYDAQDKYEAFDDILIDDEDCQLGFNLKTSLGKQLRVVLLLLRARAQFQHPAQFFSVTLGGFDTHSNQKNDQGELLRLLASQLSVFHRHLESDGLSDSVTTFTFSEFGRTLEPNGSGTDHGWGNCQMVLGGDVAGNRVLGEWPNLKPDSQDLMTRGRVIPTMSVDLFHASLLSWMGVRESGIEELFPTLKEFDQKSLPIFNSCDTGPSGRLTIAGATASAENPNGIDTVAHGVDNDLSTKWSAKGGNIDYTVELAAISTVSSIRFAQAKGDERRYYIDIEASQDGHNFVDVRSIDTDGTSDQMVEYSLGSIKAKYIRFVCHGNSDADITLNQWNNFRHIEIWGQ
ncbi:DUF1501 domain-containing protein [Vibrio mexicanus]|uniref:DUF1501 domain-containing protein n=1 Tax=Vibrio mexicanus TaxID=1004326 RepID=UPI000699EC04|nr:DUF1501 domain-containing protein [Vibrio mexicanus]